MGIVWWYIVLGTLIHCIHIYCVFSHLFSHPRPLFLTPPPALSAAEKNVRTAKLEHNWCMGAWVQWDTCAMGVELSSSLNSEINCNIVQVCDATVELHSYAYHECIYWKAACYLPSSTYFLIHAYLTVLFIPSWLLLIPLWSYVYSIIWYCK